MFKNRFLMVLVLQILISCEPDPCIRFSNTDFTVSQSITWGFPASKSEYPATVGLAHLQQRETEDNENPGEFITEYKLKSFCTGTLIDSDTILTAAHCIHSQYIQQLDGIYPINPDVKTIVTFHNNLEPYTKWSKTIPPSTFDVKSFFVHKAFSFDQLASSAVPPFDFDETLPDDQFQNADDIGLIFLDKEVSEVAPVKILNKQEEQDYLSLDSYLIMVGYGRSLYSVNSLSYPHFDQNNNQISNQESNQKSYQDDNQDSNQSNYDEIIGDEITGDLDNSSCDPSKSYERSFNGGIKFKGIGQVFKIGDHELQIGYRENYQEHPDYLGLSAKCHGDSGGPSYLMMPDSSLRLVGVTSRAYGFVIDCLTGSIDTKANSYIDWISDIKDQACENDLRLSQKCEE